MRRIKTLIKELYNIENELWDYEPKEIVKVIEDMQKENEKYCGYATIETMYCRFADLAEDNEKEER